MLSRRHGGGVYMKHIAIGVTLALAGAGLGSLATAAAMSNAGPRWVGGTITGRPDPTIWRLDTRTGYSEICIDADGVSTCRAAAPPEAQGH